MPISLSVAKRLAKNIHQASWTERFSLVESTVYLIVARAAIWLVPFRFYSRLLGKHASMDMKHGGTPPISNDDQIKCKQVRWAISVAAKHLPFEVVCLPRAIAARCMLLRRGVHSELLLGVRKETQDALVAHAWLIVSGDIVIGKTGASDHAPVARFI